MSNPALSTNHRHAAAQAAQQILANNIVDGDNGPVLQIDQKQVFYGKKDKDSRNILVPAHGRHEDLPWLVR